MSYQLTDNKASIIIVSPAGAELLMKHKVRGIVVVGLDKIRIDTGMPIRGYVLNYKEVTVPFCASAGQLAEMINGWISDCVCCNCGGDTPPDGIR